MAAVEDKAKRAPRKGATTLPADVSMRKLEVLLVMDMLREETDSEHGLTMAEILTRLEEEGIEVSNKAVYSDIETLREFGMDADLVQCGRSVEYRLAERDFEFAEVQLVVDAVASAKFLSDRKVKSLVNGLKRLVPARRRDDLDRRIGVENRVRRHSDSLFDAIACIHRAMRERKRVEFRYFGYDTSKKRLFHRGGAVYAETPVHLSFAEGFYYLYAYNEEKDKLKTYRVDRMESVKVSEENAASNVLIDQYDKESLPTRRFNAREDGKTVQATLLVKKKGMNGAIDHFGLDVPSRPLGEEAALVEVRVSPSWSFYAWLVQFGDDVRLLGPDKLVDEYRDLLRKALDLHEPEALDALRPECGA